jgi:RNA polymerase sigma factor (sigma-70 family)
MTQPDEYETLFREQLPLIEKLLAAIVRRLGLRGDDADDYMSWARVRLWEHDYAILRKWRRECLLSTYLTIVLTNLGHDFLVQRNGRWRASAAAQRLGRVAILLERLLYRYHMPLAEAGEWLRTSGEATLSDRELSVLRDQLPDHATTWRATRADSPADAVPPDTLPDDATADARLLAAETDSVRRAALRTLAAAIARLSPREQVVIRMFFLEGQTIADVSRALRVAQKPLYRIKDGALRSLQRYLKEAGMTAEVLRELLDGPLSELGGSEHADAPESSGVGVESGNSGRARPSPDTWRPRSSDDTQETVNPNRLRRHSE